MPGPTVTAPGAVVVISSHVVRGTVGNRAAVFALETLGFPVWAVPTVTLPWHPGHGPGTRIVPDAERFAALLRDLEDSARLGEVAAVLSGYLGAPDQAAAVAGLVGTVKMRNPRALYVCDPVIGDAGGLYVPQETAAAIRDRLLPLADIATPNRHELAWLTGNETNFAEAAVTAALGAGPPTMLVTSVPGAGPRAIANLLVSGGEALLAEHGLIENPPNGLGDLTAAVFTARLLSGQTPAKALQSTTASVFEVTARAVGRGADELMLETDAASLSRPMAMVQLRRLSHPRSDRPA